MKIEDVDEARRIAEDYLTADYRVEGDTMIILDDLTVTRDYGWYFEAGSKRYLETRDPKYLIAGGGPILIERETGRIIPMGTARPLEYYINEYERNG